MTRAKKAKRTVKKAVAKTKTVFVRIPSALEIGLIDAINLGLTTSSSDLIREAIKEKLEKLGLYDNAEKKSKLLHR